MSESACSGCTAPLPPGEPGAIVTCAYCGRQTRLPGAQPGPNVAALPFPVHVVASSQTLEARMAMTRAANAKLIADERRRGLRIALPIVIVAVAAGVIAILVQVGVLR